MSEFWHGWTDGVVGAVLGVFLVNIFDGIKQWRNER